MPPRKPFSERLQKIKTATDLPADLLAQLDGFCSRRKVRKCVVWELALRRFLAEEYAKEVEGGESARG